MKNSSLHLCRKSARAKRRKKLNCLAGMAGNFEHRQFGYSDVIGSHVGFGFTLHRLTYTRRNEWPSFGLKCIIRNAYGRIFNCFFFQSVNCLSCMFWWNHLISAEWQWFFMLDNNSAARRNANPFIPFSWFLYDADDGIFNLNRNQLSLQPHAAT